ncbi:MAG: cupin domain-containing protein [Syntrophomonas sp.]
MLDDKISYLFENGVVESLSGSCGTRDIAWSEHTVSKGVFLKHIVRGEDTGGALSCHLVRVNPGELLDTHIHNGKLEIHQVLEGQGIAQVGDRTMDYKAGSVNVIPADMEHQVKAGPEGVFILATFSPALL